MKNHYPQFSLELQALIEAIRLVLLKRNEEKFTALIRSSSLDWNKLQKMLEYHRIRPVFYEACRMVGFENDWVSKAEHFTKRQVMINLATGLELSRILSIFQEEKIEMLPYKGILFLEKLYQNKPLRESGDVDVLVKPEDALNSLKILLKDGYRISRKFTEIKDVDDDALLEIIERSQWKELGLDKTLTSGINVHIDFHWGFNETFHQYHTPMEELFAKSNIEVFQRKPVLIPSTEIIFKMMLNHHGGRGCWLRLKDICDLIAFRTQFPEHSLEKLSLFASEMKMQRIFEVGIQISNELFLENPYNQVKNQIIVNSIITFWETSVHYDNIIPKLKFKNIYRLIQDEPVSWFILINRHVNHYSITNKTEPKRLIVLPDKFVYLNAFSKLLTYLLHRLKLSFLKV